MLNMYGTGSGISLKKRMISFFSDIIRKGTAKRKCTTKDGEQ